MRTRNCTNIIKGNETRGEVTNAVWNKVRDCSCYYMSSNNEILKAKRNALMR
jgi:hypothetical protein